MTMPDFLNLVSGAMLFLALAATAGVLLLALLFPCRAHKDAEAVDIAAALRAAPYHRIRDVLPEGLSRRADAAPNPKAE